MKFLLAQINPTLGDIEGNVAKIKGVVRERSSDVDVIVFPEMCITGYPPQDLLLYKNFIKKATAATFDVANSVVDTVVIIGNVRISTDGDMYNSAFVIQNKAVIGFQDKSLLPSYDVFDEKRYFKHAVNIEPVKVKISDYDISIGLQICEDMWDQDYPVKVVEELSYKGADIIVNISASPFHCDKLVDRKKVIENQMSKFPMPFLYCNMVGGQDELIFDGQSLAYNDEGDLIALGKAFSEHLIEFDLNDKNVINFSLNNRNSQLYNALKLGVSDYFKKTGHNQAVIGLSGGIDSALTAVIAADSLGSENVIGVSMPSKYSSNHSLDDAKNLAKNLNIEYQVLPINPLHKCALDTLSPYFFNTKENIAEENIQSRIRGLLLMGIANKKNALVLNTGNKTETALGYCTMYGDMCGALAVISDLNKNEVYSLASWFNEQCGENIIPLNTINKEPSAELREDQKDPFDYNVISPLVDNIVTYNKNSADLSQIGFDSILSNSIINKIRKSEYKRKQAPPGLRVSRKSFGVGRRLPIVNNYRD